MGCVFPSPPPPLLFGLSCTSSESGLLRRSIFTGTAPSDADTTLYQVSLWSTPNYMSRLIENTMDAMSESACGGLR